MKMDERSNWVLGFGQSLNICHQWPTSHCFCVVDDYPFGPTENVWLHSHLYCSVYTTILGSAFRVSGTISMTHTVELSSIICISISVTNFPRNTIYIEYRKPLLFFLHLPFALEDDN